MKTSKKIVTTICTVIISLSMTAQRSHNGNQTQPQSQPQQSQNNNQNDKHHHGWSNNHHGPNWGGNLTVQIGGAYPNSY